MNPDSASTLRDNIETYIRAKDGNRPHLIGDAFTAGAVLTMTLRTAEIAFPAQVQGAPAIADTLVSQFGTRYENVYTFCLGPAPVQHSEFECDWLVCMSEKHTGMARVGFGRYRWVREVNARRVSELEITIERMSVLPGEHMPALLAWASNLPYPWCRLSDIALAQPEITAVAEICSALSARGV